MFPQDAIIIDEESGKQFRVLATPDQAKISTHYTSGDMEGITKKVPCYALQPVARGEANSYIEQSEAEKNFKLSGAV
jgi:hypothetical protein